LRRACAGGCRTRRAPPPPFASARPARSASKPSSPYTTAQPPHPSIIDTGASPGLAFLLGFIPGVGAIYNGQYVKGLIHVVVFGLLISIVSSDDMSGNLQPLIRDDDRGVGFLHGV
jgi:hypothetical protein